MKNNYNFYNYKKKNNICSKKTKINIKSNYKKYGFETLFIIFFTVFVFIGSVVIISYNFYKDLNPKINNITDNQVAKEDLQTFNSVFEIYNGIQVKENVISLINNVDANNKTTKIRAITIVYNNNNYSNIAEFLNLKQILTSDNYEISLEYNEKGFVNKVNILDIN